MNLLVLDDHKASLEMRPDEVGDTLARLRALGGYSIEPMVTYDLVRADGSEFIYLDEWDAPCLISADAAGSAILAWIEQSGEQRRKIAL